MGYRLHVASKYDVKYSTTEAFNYKCEEFHNLLLACGVDFTGETYDANFEVSREDWNKMIEKLKTLDQLPEEERLEIQDCIQDLETTPEKVLDITETLLSEADPDNSYLYFSYW